MLHDLERDRPTAATDTGGGSLLAADEIHSGYGRAEVLRGASLAVQPREAVAIVGPNGAGKTTLLRTICGIIRTWSGSVAWCGARVKRPSPASLARAGLVYVPEEFCVFAPLTVKQNLDVSALAIAKRPTLDDYERIFELFPVLHERRDQRAGTLSGGEQRMLGIARGLLTKPRLLVLDEPSGGLAAIVIKQLAVVLRLLHEEGLSILVAEQNLSLVEAVADRVYLLDRGVVSWEGPSHLVSNNDTVAQAVLGRGLASSR